MFAVVKKGFSLASSGLDAAGIQGLLEAVRLSLNPRIARFGRIESIAEQPGGGLGMRLRLAGVADEVHLAAERVEISADGGQIRLAGFTSSVPLAAKLLNGLCGASWEVGDPQARLVLRQIGQALSR